MKLTIEIEQEEDGRWIAEGTELSGAMVYGATQIEAVARVQALALHVLANRPETGEMRHETIQIPSDLPTKDRTRYLIPNNTSSTRNLWRCGRG